MPPHLLVVTPAVPVRALAEALELRPGVAHRHLLVRKGVAEGLAYHLLHLRGRAGRVVLAPLAEDAEFDEGHARIIVPCLTEALHQPCDPRLELRAGVVIGLHVLRPVLLRVRAPVQVDAGDELDVVGGAVGEALLADLQDPVEAVRFGILEFVPAEIDVLGAGPGMADRMREALHRIAQRTVVVRRRAARQLKVVVEDQARRAGGRGGSLACRHQQHREQNQKPHGRLLDFGTANPSPGLIESAPWITQWREV